MIVRECFTEVRRDKDGKRYTVHGERMVEMPDVLTEAEGMELTQADKTEEWNAQIREQLNALDTSEGIRAVTEALAGDTTRLDKLEAAKAELRSQFRD